MQIIIYQDLAKDQKHGYSASIVATDNSLIVREMIVPGLHGYPPLYVRHLKVTFNNLPQIIISQTDYELTLAKRLEIIAGAVEFLQQME